jgi:hypothetical protein
VQATEINMKAIIIAAAAALRMKHTQR